MIFQNSVTNAIFTILSSDQGLIDMDTHIFQNDLFNQDPNFTPWIGVYNSPVSVEAERVQKPNPWKIIYRSTIYVQNQNQSYSGDVTVEGLDILLNATITAIDTHNNIARDLMGTVDIIKGYEINPYQVNIDEDSVMFAYEIIINSERRKN